MDKVIWKEISFSFTGFFSFLFESFIESFYLKLYNETLGNFFKNTNFVCVSLFNKSPSDVFEGFYRETPITVKVT